MKFMGWKKSLKNAMIISRKSRAKGSKYGRYVY